MRVGEGTVHSLKVGCARRSSTADLVHRTFRLDEARFADAMCGAFGADAHAHQIDHRGLGLIGRLRAAEDGTHVPLGGGKQAVAQFAFGRKPQAVAAAAEGLRHRVNESNAAHAVGELLVDRRLARVVRHDGRERRNLGFEDFSDRLA